jgi:hypothetical protein
MEPEGYPLLSQQCATCPCLKSFKFNPCPPPSQFLERSLLVLLSHLCLGLPNGLFHSGFPTKCLHASLLSSISATFPAYLILDCMTWIMFGVQYKSWSSSLCSFLHPLPHPSLTEMSSAAPYSQTPNSQVLPSMWETKFQTHIKQEVKLHFCIF